MDTTASMRKRNNLYKDYTDDAFKDAEAFKKFLNAGHKLSYDYVIVGGILYTMHEYDIGGQLVTWANKKHNKMMEVRTSNRYHNGYIDAEVEIYDASYLRSDIVYAE